MSIYNEDELVAPAWINKEFLEKVLSKYENNENVEVGWEVNNSELIAYSIKQIFI